MSSSNDEKKNKGKLDDEDVTSEVNKSKSDGKAQASVDLMSPTIPSSSAAAAGVGAPSNSADRPSVNTRPDAMIHGNDHLVRPAPPTTASSKQDEEDDKLNTKPLSPEQERGMDETLQLQDDAKPQPFSKGVRQMPPSLQMTMDVERKHLDEECEREQVQDFTATVTTATLVAKPTPEHRAASVLSGQPPVVNEGEPPHPHEPPTVPYNAAGSPSEDYERDHLEDNGRGQSIINGKEKKQNKAGGLSTSPMHVENSSSLPKKEMSAGDINRPTEKTKGPSASDGTEKLPRPLAKSVEREVEPDFEFQEATVDPSVVVKPTFPKEERDIEKDLVLEEKTINGTTQQQEQPKAFQALFKQQQQPDEPSVKHAMDVVLGKEMPHVKSSLIEESAKDLSRMVSRPNDVVYPTHTFKDSAHEAFNQTSKALAIGAKMAQSAAEDMVTGLKDSTEGLRDTRDVTERAKTIASNAKEVVANAAGSGLPDQEQARTIASNAKEAVLNAGPVVISGAKEVAADVSETVERAKVVASNAREVASNVAGSEPVQRAGVVVSNAAEVASNIAASDQVKRAGVVAGNAKEALVDLTLHAPVYAKAVAESDQARRASTVASNATEVVSQLVQAAPGTAMEVGKIIKTNAETLMETPAGQAVKNAPQTVKELAESEQAQRAVVVASNTVEAAKNLPGMVAHSDVAKNLTVKAMNISSDLQAEAEHVAGQIKGGAIIAGQMAGMGVAAARDVSVREAESLAQGAKNLASSTASGIKNVALGVEHAGEKVVSGAEVVLESGVGSVVHGVENVASATASGFKNVALGVEHTGEKVVSTATSGAKTTAQGVENLAGTAASGVGSVVHGVEHTAATAASGVSAIIQGVKQTEQAVVSTGAFMGNTAKDGAEALGNSANAVVQTGKDIVSGGSRVLGTVAAVVQGASSVVDMASTTKDSTTSSLPVREDSDVNAAPVRTLDDFLLHPEPESDNERNLSASDMNAPVENEDDDQKKAERRFGFFSHSKVGSPLDQILTVMMDNGGDQNQGVGASATTAASLQQEQTEMSMDEMVEAMYVVQEKEQRVMVVTGDVIDEAVRGDAPHSKSSPPSKGLLRSAWDSLKSRFSASGTIEGQGNEIGGISKDVVLGSSKANTPQDKEAGDPKKIQARMAKARQGTTQDEVSGIIPQGREIGGLSNEAILGSGDARKPGDGQAKSPKEIKKRAEKLKAKL